ncbi:MAG: hypothetical protein IM584_04605 [Chitinophagaceae bacterium]|nr:hypothetical protein [Chitinophagaceae bacterium]MCA6453634.1 hypothetical protein [Chitinophagaceae bacterium]MCA6455397.1 hypothetical protein [Chitinophagaceae bacterium]MCA6459051.1 hypothetical protein [Chitinophagaceae bacterium]MCA6465581.1 hypothetical protein [Chitinophagaceae bacterium]
MRKFENADLMVVKGYSAANIPASKGLIFKFSNFQIRFYWSFLYFCPLVEFANIEFNGSIAQLV